MHKVVHELYDTSVWANTIADKGSDSFGEFVVDYFNTEFSLDVRTITVKTERYTSSSSTISKANVLTLLEASAIL